MSQGVSTFDGMDATVTLEILTGDCGRRRGEPAGVPHRGDASRLESPRCTGTTRFHQKGTAWLTILGLLLERLGHRSWMYQEGRRGVFVCETSWAAPPSVPSSADASFCRGYFDADGGMPRDLNARLYFQYAQKNRPDLADIRGRLIALGVDCGDLHRPSAQVAPDYWRFFIRARSFAAFMESISSWHPLKRAAMLQRGAVLRTKS